MPKNAKNLTLSSRLKVELVFNQPIDTDSMVDSYNSLHYLCYLVNDSYSYSDSAREDNSKYNVYPYKVITEQKFMSLYFDFSQTDFGVSKDSSLMTKDGSVKE